MKYIYVIMIVAGALVAGSTHAVEWDFNGFASAGGGSLSIDGADESAYAGYENDVSWKPDSVFGAQISANFTPRLSATVQALSRGSNDFEPEIEWAYVSAQITDDVMIRAGRLRPPLFIVSDYLDVSYAYPWIRPPQEVYRNAPLTRYEGADIVVSRNVGQWFTTVQAYGGSEEGTQIFNGTPAQRKLDSYMGVAVTTQRDALTLRASYHQADVTFTTEGTEQLFAMLTTLGFGSIAAELNMSEKAGVFYEAAFIYDRDDWFVRGEATHTDFARGFLADQLSWYITGGKSFGDVTPYLTTSRVRAKGQTGFNDTIPLGVDPGLDVLYFTVDAVGNANETDDLAISVGSRWDVFSRTALKLEYTRVDGRLDNDMDYGLISVAVNVLF